MTRRQIREIARLRVEAAWGCVRVLRPDLTTQEKKKLAKKVLDLASGDWPGPPAKIAPAQVTEIVWRNSQCINPRCPMLLFSDMIARELNEFFHPQE